TAPAPPPASAQATVHAAASPALPDPLPLARALRPLRRQLASGRRMRINEEATADRAAEQRLWLPVLTPVGEPAVDLTLVIDASESMELWGALIHEFRLICEQVGAFGD